MFKKNKKYVLDISQLNINKWYNNIEILFKEIEIDNKYHNFSIIDLYNKYNKDKSLKLLIKQLYIYKDYNNNLPFFELYLIKMIQLNSNKTIIDLICLNNNEYYPNYHNFYTYEKTPTKKLFNKIVNNNTYNQYIYTLRKYFSYNNSEKLDFIIVSHYNHNNQLTNYFNDINKLLLKKYPKYTLNNYSYINKNNNINEINNFVSNNTNTYFKLFACILRNINEDKKQKTIIGIIEDNRQYILNNTIKKEFNWVDDNKLINQEYLIVDDTGFVYKYNFALGNSLLLYYNNTIEKLKEINKSKIKVIQKTERKLCWVEYKSYIEPISTTVKPFAYLMDYINK